MVKLSVLVLAFTIHLEQKLCSMRHYSSYSDNSGRETMKKDIPVVKKLGQGDAEDVLVSQDHSSTNNEKKLFLLTFFPTSLLSKIFAKAQQKGRAKRKSKNARQWTLL